MTEKTYFCDEMIYTGPELLEETETHFVIVDRRTKKKVYLPKAGTRIEEVEDGR